MNRTVVALNQEAMTMEMTAEQFRADVVKHRGQRGRGAPRYSTEQRAFAIAFAEQGLRHGRSITKSSRELGLADMTLREWVKRSQSDKSDSSKLHQVVVRASAQQPSGLMLIAPSGYRVRGLDLPSTLALLRALG